LVFVASYARSRRRDAICQPGSPSRAPYQKLAAWVEETLTFYRLPRQHHKHLKSTDMLERLNEEIRRRTYIVRNNRSWSRSNPAI